MKRPGSQRFRLEAAERNVTQGLAYIAFLEQKLRQKADTPQASLVAGLLDKARDMQDVFEAELARIQQNTEGNARE